VFAVGLAAALSTSAVWAKTYTVNIPFVGTVNISISSSDETADDLNPRSPEIPDFLTQRVFAPPGRVAPSGSAQSLGGAYTALADDPTASVWNPAGLAPCDGGPGVYVGGHWGSHSFAHDSTEPGFDVCENAHGESVVDYIGVVCPFNVFERDCAFALSARRAYDFTHRFSADLHQSSSETHRSQASETDKDSASVNFVGPPAGNLSAERVTRLESDMTEVLSSDVTTSLQFAQNGSIDAVSPAFAIACGPRCSAGLTVNVFTDNLLNSRPISSSTVSRYSGTSENVSTIVTEEDEEITFSYNAPAPVGAGGGTLDDSSSSRVDRRRRVIHFEGEYEERSEYAGLFGANATLGVLCSLTERLRAGVSVDLPWRAGTTHTTSTRNTLKTLDPNGNVIGVTETESSETQDAVFTFPMHSAAGLAWNWTDNFLTALDVQHTQWSRFCYRPKAGPGSIPWTARRTARTPSPTAGAWGSGPRCRSTSATLPPSPCAEAPHGISGRGSGKPIRTTA